MDALGSRADPQSLRGCLLEESYEASTRSTATIRPTLRDELGDLLLQIVLQADMAAAAGRFTIEDVITGIVEKMTRRHPHVFAGATVSDTDEVCETGRASRARKAQRRAPLPTRRS
jgi:uncharacterized protein YabN with tetrapyrrole methylase and pyrophosphatase domain